METEKGEIEMEEFDGKKANNEKLWYKGQPAEVVWDKITWDIGKNRILHGVGGAVRGKLMAILGGSGAGKSTLLNILSARAKGGKLSGMAYINGEEITKEVVREVGGFVQQDDLFFSHLTVKETLKFAANLRLPANLSRKEKNLKVDEIIQQLGLKKCENVVVGGFGKKGISGGERKRLSIGVELLAEPQLLYLDEPTSGLDSATAYSILKILKDITNRCNVICTIHQPSSRIFDLFDELMVLSNGRVVYFGGAKEAIEFYASQGFECPPHANPADYFLEVISAGSSDKTAIENAKENTEKLATYFEETVAPKIDTSPQKFSKKSLKALMKQEGEKMEIDQKISEKEKSIKKAGFLKQFTFLLQRSANNYYRNYSFILIQLMQNLVIAILIGLVFLQLPLDQTGISRRFASLWFIAVNQGVYSAFGVLTTFPLERSIVLRERRSGTYRTLPYFLAKSLAELPVQLIICIIFCNIVYWMVGYQTSFEHYMNFVNICVLTNMVAISVGLFVSAASPRMGMAMVLCPILLEMYRLYGSYYSTPIPLPNWLIWMQAISFYTYTFQGLAHNEFLGLQFYCTPEQLVGPDKICPTTSGEIALEKFNVWDLNAWHCELILIGWLLFYRVLTYFFLLRNKRG